MATLIPVNGPSVEVAPKAKTFSLAEMYALLDCDLVEAITLADGRRMWLDEEGKFAGKGINAPATVLLHSAGGSMFDYIVGPVLITKKSEVN